MRFSALPLLLTLGLVAGSPAAPFQDVPEGHWAEDSIERVQEDGVLQGRGKSFEGQRPTTRYELAAVAARLLEKIRGARSTGDLSPQDRRDLEAIVSRVGQDHLLLLDEVIALREGLQNLEERVEAPPPLAPSEFAPAPLLAPTLSRGVAQAMTGFLSVGLVRTQEGANGRGGGFTRYHLDGSRTLDQLFFSLPQASLAIHHEVRPGTLLHMQFDYTTNAADPVGAGVGLNEAYMRRDRFFGTVGGKLGGFALPFQDWEFDGRFRTLTRTLTPSVIGTFLERFRVIGVEMTRLVDQDPSDLRWRLGLFTGGDLPVTPTGDIFPPPSQDDSVGLGALSRTATFDGSLGYYLDFQSGDGPEQRWGWRAGYFDLGGDLGASGSRTPSQDFTGLNLGLWWRTPDERLRLQSQYATASRRFVQAGYEPTELEALYLQASWELARDSTLTIRRDDLGFEKGTILPGNQADLSSWVVAWSQRLSETDLLQFEYLAQDQPIPPRALVHPTGQPDPADDLLQMRYKVWF